MHWPCSESRGARQCTGCWNVWAFAWVLLLGYLQAYRPAERMAGVVAILSPKSTSRDLSETRFALFCSFSYLQSGCVNCRSAGTVSFAPAAVQLELGDLSVGDNKLLG
ncbi:hypothetical protein F4861DRAFT_76291 [Xylaria intraflava]|nr:hypothetical protein F4861DRAFT_76291 [Xylaria intraflava]